MKKHRFQGGPDGACAACGQLLPHLDHTTVTEEAAEEDAAAFAAAQHEALQAEHTVALSRLKELHFVLGGDDRGNPLTDIARADALATITLIQRDHDLAKGRAKMLEDRISSLSQSLSDSQAATSDAIRKSREMVEERQRLYTLHNEKLERIVDLEAVSKKYEEENRRLEREVGRLAARPTPSDTTPDELTLLRVMRQYGCIDTKGNLDAAKCQAALDFVKKTSVPEGAHPMPLRTAPVVEPATPQGPIDITKEAQQGRIELLQERLDDEQTAGTAAKIDVERLLILNRSGMKQLRTYYTILQQECEKLRLLLAEKGAAPTAFDLSTKRLLELAVLSPSGKKIVDECFRLAEMLIEKNIAYGDSALSPLRLFAKGIDARAQILVRLDDKLSRLARGSAAGEDVILDLLGYLILYRIAPVTAEVPSADPAVVENALQSLVVQPPTPKEVTTMRTAAAESEKNSPYPEFNGFVECPACSAKPGAPILCYHCLMRRSAAEARFVDERGTRR